MMATYLFRTYVIKLFKSEICTSSNISFARFCSQPNFVTSLTVSTSKPKEDVLDVCKEDVSDYAPYLAPTFNIAAYANKSHTIQQFVKLGVDLSRIEKKGFMELILKSDFERDVRKYIEFLNDVGVPASEYGNFFTVNPSILKENLDNLAVRINYLESKNFRAEDIIRILSKNPKWISHSTEDIDGRLGFFQDHFHLDGNEVRQVTLRMPKLITYNLRHVETNEFTIKEEMGFKNLEVKALLLQKPKIFVLSRKSLQQRLDYLLNTLNIPQSQIAKQPAIITARLERIKHRHNFLAMLKKNQYDCYQPGYISLESLVRGSDVEFCDKVAGTSVQTYNAYLKTL